MSNVAWEKLNELIAKESIEMHTIDKNEEIGKWFLVTYDDCKITVCSATKNTHSVQLKQKRYIARNDFMALYALYDEWRNGTVKRSDIREISYNSSYILGIIYWLRQNIIRNC